jgi:hypothetical protein
MKEVRAVSDPRQDLRATAESIRRDAEAIAELEEQKIALDPHDPRVDALAERIEQKVGQMSTKAAAERDLAEELDPPS